MTTDEAMALRPGDLIYGPGVRAPIVRVTNPKKRLVTVVHTSYIFVRGARVQHRKRPWWATTRAGGIAQIDVPLDTLVEYSLLPAGGTLELAVLEANHVGDP